MSELPWHIVEEGITKIWEVTFLEKMECFRPEAYQKVMFHGNGHLTNCLFRTSGVSERANNITMNVNGGCLLQARAKCGRGVFTKQNSLKITRIMELQNNMFGGGGGGILRQKSTHHSYSNNHHVQNVFDPRKS